MTADRVWAFPIGRLFGIPLRVHATFLVLVIWVGVMTARSGLGFVAGAGSILLFLGCVVIHELGHALAALRYGVRTREILLFPVGGLARLDGVPRGGAELVIAAAGPLANLAAALALLPVAALAALQGPLRPGLGLEPSVLFPNLVLVNLGLFLINLLPAYPMDGGRMLRGWLSLVTDEPRATRIALTTGRLLAAGLAAVGVLAGGSAAVALLLLAAFVWLGASREAAVAAVAAPAAGGRTARDAMTSRFETVAPQETLEHAAQLLLRTPQEVFPVVDAWGRPRGLLTPGRIVAALAEHGREVAVLEVMERDPLVVSPTTPLAEVQRALERRPAVLVGGEADGLLGMVTGAGLRRMEAILAALARQR